VIEAVVVVAGVGVLALLALLAPHVPVEPVLMAGAISTALGLLLGVPTGFWYHVKLRTALRSVDLLPDRWWVHPVSLHGEIPEPLRRGVLLWFYIGGAGFVITILGCLVVTAALLLVFFERSLGRDF